MFTGIITEVGKVVGIRGLGGGKTIVIEAPGYRSLTKGESIAVNGVCLTVAQCESSRFWVEVSPHSLERTTLGEIQIGDLVNLERSLSLSDRLGGHLVLGHVDGIGKILRLESEGNSRRLWISFPEDISSYLIPRGSIAVDGISLTVAELKESEFSVVIVPFSWENTALSQKKPGSLVNLEADVIGKYVARVLKTRLSPESPRNPEFLRFLE